RPTGTAPMPPPGFSWVDKPHLAALAVPDTPEDLAWLRRNAIDVLVSLTEDPLPRHWVNDAGLIAVNVPVPDMEPPTDRQLDRLPFPGCHGRLVRPCSWRTGGQAAHGTPHNRPSGSRVAGSFALLTTVRAPLQSSPSRGSHRGMTECPPIRSPASSTGPRPAR